jgi:hypothetical protein
LKVGVLAKMARLAFGGNYFHSGNSSAGGGGGWFKNGTSWRLPVADVDLAGHGGGDQGGAAFLEESDGPMGLCI